MHADVSTTLRKKQTPKQRLAMFEAHKGICVICKTKITNRKWIDEHIRALGLGGSNDLSNRGPAHIECAEAKTNGPEGDNARIAKAKRQKTQKFIGREPSRKIPSRPFPSKKEGIGDRDPLPPRRMFRDV